MLKRSCPPGFLNVSVLLSLMLFAFSPELSAQKVFTTSGDWSNGGNWSPSGVPQPSDIVIINPGTTLTIDQNATCDSLFFAAGTTGSTININGGVTFTVTNNVRFSDPTANNQTQTINAGTGNFICNNITFINTSANSRINRILLSTGTVTVNGNMIMEGNNAAKNQIVCSGSGSIDLNGTWTVTTGTYTPSTSSFIYSNTADQVIRGTTYNKLILREGNKTLGGTTTVNDSLIIESGGTLTNGGNVSLTANSVFYVAGTYTESSTQGSVTFAGLVHIATTGIFQATVGEAFTIRNGIRNDGTFTSGSGTYTFSTNNQVLEGDRLISFTGAVTVTGIILTNNDSVQVAGTFSGTGTFTNAANAYLRLNGSTNSITVLDASASENVVIYGRSGTQTVKSTTYQNLQFAGSNTKTAAGAVTVNDELNIPGGLTFAMSTFALSAGSGFSSTGTGTLNTTDTTATPIPSGRTWSGTVSYTSTSAQTIIDGIYNNLTASGGNRTFSPADTIYISGTFTPGTGTYTVTGSTVEYNGTSSQTIAACNYFNLVSSSTGARVLASSGTIGISGTFTRGSNSYTTTGSTININGGADQVIPLFSYNNLTVTDGFTKTIPGTMTLSGNLVLTSGKLAIGSNTLTINGTVTSSATNCIVANGSSNLTFGGSGAATTFHMDQTSNGTTNRIETLTINRTGITVTMGNNIHVNTALVLTAGKLAPGSNTLTLNGTLTSTATNSITANGSSALNITGSGNITLFMDQTTSGTTNRLGSLTFNRTGNTLLLGNALQVNSAFTLTAGRVSLNKMLLTLNGTVTTDATNNITGGPGCSITFGGSGDASFFMDQTTPGTTNRITTLIVNRTGNTVTMSNNLSLARLTLTAGRIGIGSNTLTIDSLAAFIFGAAMSSSNNIRANGSSNLTIITSDNSNLTNPTIFFDQTSDGTTNRLNNFILNLGGNSRSVTLGSNMQVATALTLTSGDLAVGSNTLTINGTLTNDANSLITANGSSSLNFTGTGDVSLFLNQTTSGTTNRLGSLTFNRTGSTLTMSNAMQIAGTLSLTNGRLAIGSNTLTLNGNVVSSATNHFVANGSSNISYTGSGNATLFLDQSTDNTTNRLSTLTINRTGGVITQGSNVRITTLALTAGQLAIGSNTLFINGTATTVFAAALTSTNNIIANGSSNLSITTSNNAAVTNSTLFFDQSTDGTTNRLSSFTINLGGNTRSLTLGNSLHVESALTLTQGDLAIGSNTLTLNGTLSSTTNNLLISNGSSSITIGGSGALGSNVFLDQTTPGTTNRLVNLTYNRASQTITLGNAVQVTGAVNPTAGTLATGGFLTLISNASGTACITTGSGSYISGSVTVQRFIPAVARRFRFMSSPVSSRTLDDWQDEFFITGPGGATNGFDATATNTSTVYSYTESAAGSSNTGWTDATNITNTIVTGRGYRVFMRGDRSNPGRLDNTVLTQNEVTPNLIGSVHTGDIELPVTFTNNTGDNNDGWNLVGNPYPCHFNWNSYFDAATGYSNIDATIFIYDPNSNGYKSFNASSNVGDITNGIIPSGSGFFVRATGASPTLTVNETHKVTTVPATLFKTSSEDFFRIRIVQDSITSDAAFLKYMDEATEEYDKYDIEKLGGGVNISTITDAGLALTANCKPFTGEGDTIPLNVVSGISGTFTLEFTNAAKLTDKTVFLYDAHNQNVINLKTADKYEFSIDLQQAATFGKERFSIIIGSDMYQTGTKNTELQNRIAKIYPTTVTNVLTLTRQQQQVNNPVTVQVYDLLGKQVIPASTHEWINGNIVLNLDGLNPGNYIMMITDAVTGNSQTARFIKQ